MLAVNKSEKISIAMAVYNGERFIREQLDSYLAQTRLPDELVVSDNASTDSTLEIVREFAARAPFPVRVFINDRNLGVTKNFERAITESTGDIIFLSDADDVWYEEKIARMTTALIGAPTAGVITCNADYVDDELRPLGARTWDRFTLSAKSHTKLAAGEAFSNHLPPFGNALAFRGALREKLLPFPDNDFYQRQGHDGFIVWVICCSGSGGFLQLETPFLAYRQHSQQVTRVTLDQGKRRRAHRQAWRIRPRERFLPILERLEELGEPANPRRAKVHRAVVRHLRARCNLPRSRVTRLGTIAKEVISGGYQRYSPRGLLTAARDLCLCSEIRTDDLMATLTTVIPTYRRPRLLDRAIRSVLAQSYPDFEVHVYDNASGDETPEVVAQIAAHDLRVKYHCHPRNIGMMENFAFGIAQVATPYFNILSDDDFLLPGFFESAISALREFPVAGFFLGAHLYADSNGQVVAAPLEEIWKADGFLPPPELFEVLAPGAWVTWTAMVFNSGILPVVGGLDTAMGHTGDVDLILRAALRFAALVSKQPCAVLTMHPDSASERDRVQVLEKHLDLTQSRKIERAILDAGEDCIFPPARAAALAATYRSRIARDFFRRGLLVALQGETRLARRAANTLRHDLGQPGLAALIFLAAAPGAVGGIPRLAARGVRRARRQFLDAGKQTGHSRHTNLVQECLSNLPLTELLPSNSP